MHAAKADPTTDPERHTEVKFFIHFNYSLHKMKGRLISSVHKNLIRNGIFVQKIRDLAFRGLIGKIYYMQKSPMVLRKEEGAKGAGDGERNKGFYLIKNLQEKSFSLSWSLYTRAADSKGSLPCDVFRDH